MYEYLNSIAKKYLTKELRRNFFKKFDLKDLFRRCEKEMDILYERNLLFIVEHLYKFKKENKNVKYHFRGTINNLLLLYVLDISYVNPLEYNLPYELFNDKTINVDIINEPSILFINYLNKQADDFKIIHGNFIKEDIREINKLLENHYLLLPCGYLDNSMLLKFNDLDTLETIDDYRNYKDKYMTIRIDEKDIIRCDNVCLDNIFTNDFEKEISKILKPKTINDYIKIKSMAHGVNVWDCNQDKLFSKKKIKIDTLIATREDILEYLLNHKIERNIALEITMFISLGKMKKEPDKWNEYVTVMKKYNCEDMYINIFSKILFIFGRGQAVSECLFVLDKDHYDINNYYDNKKNKEIRNEKI